MQLEIIRKWPKKNANESPKFNVHGLGLIKFNFLIRAHEVKIFIIF